MGRGEHFVGRQLKPTHTGIVFTYQAKDFAGKDVTFVNTHTAASFVWVGALRYVLGGGEEITVAIHPGAEYLLSTGAGVRLQA